MEPNRYHITVTKRIEASPAQIWRTWTDPEAYAKVHDSYQAAIDFRVGGKAHVRYAPDKEAGETLVFLATGEGIAGAAWERAHWRYKVVKIENRA